MIRTITATMFIAAVALLSTACSDNEQTPHPATTTTSVTSTQQTPAPESSPPAPSASVRTKPGAAPQVTSSNADSPAVACEGTVCTNPNHGAGSNPQENGGAVIQNPQGGNAVAPCEGTICTNPNQGAGN